MFFKASFLKGEATKDTISEIGEINWVLFCSFFTNLLNRISIANPVTRITPKSLIIFTQLCCPLIYSCKDSIVKGNQKKQEVFSLLHGFHFSTKITATSILERRHYHYLKL